MADDVLSMSRAELDAAQARRTTLHRACAHLRGLLESEPAPVGPSGALAGAVADVAHLWDRHVHATEAPDGLLNQILTDAPRLAGMVERFRREHPAIGDHLTAARQVLELSETDVVTVRRRLIVLLDGIDRHRRGGHELIYRAYCVDIGLGE
jgi:crotonobetainyl-CoA:carnitine CoA-transferase CaiB-like acyl-CoA transferase